MIPITPLVALLSQSTHTWIAFIDLLIVSLLLRPCCRPACTARTHSSEGMTRNGSRCDESPCSSTMAVSDPPTLSSSRTSDTLSTHASKSLPRAQAGKSDKKKSASRLGSFLAVKEPSSQALEEYRKEQARLAAAAGKSLSMPSRGTPAGSRGEENRSVAQIGRREKGNSSSKRRALLTSREGVVDRPLKNVLRPERDQLLRRQMQQSSSTLESDSSTTQLGSMPSSNSSRDGLAYDARDSDGQVDTSGKPRKAWDMDALLKPLEACETASAISLPPFGSGTSTSLVRDFGGEETVDTANAALTQTKPSAAATCGPDRDPCWAERRTTPVRQPRDRGITPWDFCEPPLHPPSSHEMAEKEKKGSKRPGIWHFR